MTSANPFNAVVTAIPLDDDFLVDIGSQAKDAWDIVLNVGAEDGVQVGQIYIVFALGPELSDPLTNEPLGHYEVVRGRGRVSHVQERICTLRSARSRTVQKQPSSTLALLGHQSTETYEMPLPFALVTVGDLAKRV